MEKSAKVISFINLKGGVGKTSSAINIADELSKIGTVLVIDMDPQFNATQSLLNYQFVQAKEHIPQQILDSAEEKFKKEYEDKIKVGEQQGEVDIEKTKFDMKSQMVYQELKDAKITANTLFKKDAIISDLLYPDLIYKIKDNLSLLPGDLDLFQTLNGDSVGKHNILEDHFNKYHLRNDYEYIIIDCPPNWTILTQASLFASDYYVIPSKIDLFSSIGIGLLENLVTTTFYKETSNLYSTYSMFRDKIQRKPVKPLGVLFTLTHDIVISNTIKEKLRKELSSLNFFNSEIPYLSSVPLKFSLYSETGDKYSSLTNALEKVVTEIKDIIMSDDATEDGGQIDG
ncbi:ParA family protein [Trichococcus ilyis]|uniref:Chromosome partitioning protein n=1 Tax=Trichococcus ilyis TaxID=640938 RepID=A0A143Z7H8_9LACT|nr:AAA family ATPase [Trichococcus ilyis]CZR09476.1 Hypothetical protein TR210_2729 [Trichococcus ilyis]SEJ96297.1 chromosome partitioning protein [Trichococcus ilyis]